MCVIFSLCFILFCNLSHYTVAIFSVWSPRPCLLLRVPCAVIGQCASAVKWAKIIPRSGSADPRQRETELNKPLQREAALRSDSCRTEAQQSDARFSAMNWALNWVRCIMGDLNTNLKMTCFLFHHCPKVRFRINDPEGKADKHPCVIQILLRRAGSCPSWRHVKGEFSTGGFFITELEAQMSVWQRGELNHAGFWYSLD